MYISKNNSRVAHYWDPVREDTDCRQISTFHMNPRNTVITRDLGDKTLCIHCEAGNELKMFGGSEEELKSKQSRFKNYRPGVVELFHGRKTKKTKRAARPQNR